MDTNVPTEIKQNTQKKNSMAVIAFIFAIVGIFVPLLAPIALILGIISRKKIKQTHESGDGLAKWAIGIGGVWTAIILFSLVASSILPSFFI